MEGDDERGGGRVKVGGCGDGEGGEIEYDGGEGKGVREGLFKGFDGREGKGRKGKVRGKTEG